MSRLIEKLVAASMLGEQLDLWLSCVDSGKLPEPRPYSHGLEKLVFY